MAGETPMPQGGGEITEAKYVGGFGDDFTVRIRETGPAQSNYVRNHPNALVRNSQYTTSGRVSLAQLREIGQGGYVSTDVWEPQNLSPPTVAQLQVMLNEAGLLGDGFTPGAYDETTRKAYGDLLARANATGSTWESMLARMRDNPLAAEAQQNDRAPLVTRLSNPEDLKTVFRTAAKRALGYGNIPDEDLDRMVAAYQGMESSSQQAQYGAQETGGTITAPMDPEVFADQQAKQLDPTAYDSRKVVSKFQVMAEMFGGGQ